MSIPSSLTPLFNSGSSGAAALQIERSLRFNSSDSAYLSRTPGTAGNRKKFTISFWVKRTALDGGTGPGDHSALFSAGNWTSDSDFFNILFGAGIGIGFLNFGMSLNATFRDLSAWYHFVCAVDTDQAVLNDRIKFYQNGIDLNLAVSASVTQGLSTAVNNTVIQAIGKASASNFYYLNGYLANFHIIDGQQLTPASFAETDATTGAWNPKTYTGSYGTNGFNLLFADNSSNTASTLGKDTSGNSNNWTPNNLSVTAGVGNDSLVDSPSSFGTDTGVGGEVRGNYCTLNAVNKGLDATLSNGNLDISYGSSSSVTGTPGTIGVSSGKWYWEVTPTGGTGSNASLGIVNTTANSSVSSGIGYYVGYTANGWGYEGDGGTKRNAGSSAYGATFTTNDVIGVAFDADNGTLTFYKNGVSQGQAFSSLTSGPFFPAVSDGSELSTLSMTCNFGQRAFAYTAPSGFKALCTQNLPAPLVAKPSTVFDVITYTGTGAALTPTSSLGFNPDWIWIKSRSAATDHALYDVVRGAQARLESNTTDAEVTTDGGVTAFNSAGFTLGTLAQVNTSAATYVAWCWDAGTSTVSNTAGSITSQVRANATAGFSVVTYTGTGANATVGHGLGVAPGFIIIKNRSAVTNWRVYHSALGNTKAIFLSTTGTSDTSSVYWNNTSPTSTVFSVGSDDGANGNTNLMVAYCFTPVVGYSSFGSYTGNGSTDGPFVYTGFRPKWVMIKGSSFAGESWFIWDTSRNTYNQMGARLLANEALAENSDQVFGDILSNGFKLRNAWGGINTSSATYIYAAFAEMPFNYSRAR